MLFPGKGQWDPVECGYVKFISFLPQRGPSHSPHLPDRRVKPGGSEALLLGNNGQDERNCLKWSQGRFNLGIREYFFTDRVVKPWNRLLRAVEELPSLERFRRCVDVIPGDVV